MRSEMGQLQMSAHGEVQPTDQAKKVVTDALLEITDVERVIRVEIFTVDNDELLVAAKVSLDPELAMQQVSVVVALAERRVIRELPNATHVYITPDVHIDQQEAPSTSAIVTLSYD
jgi:divalent metal cation (Fe/Co/Zn/Cd) transporter